MRDRRPLVALGLVAAATVQLIETRVADACGCLSPPVPTVGETDYTVNQSGEQIIFEVEPGWVTAHVLIRYQGDPSKFAWLVPVPEVPELGISPVSAFGLLDNATAPAIQVSQEDLCPRSAWACHYEHSSDSGFGCGGAAASNDFGGVGLSDAGVSDAGGAQPPVTVINEQTVGDYQTVTFRASEAGAATQWLRDNGFIVNPTTSIYMESYIQANMVFVAAKLVAGAGISAIKPLRMRYRAAFPTVPLILTAVAAQPNLTVTSFIYANQAFRPQGHPVIQVPANRLAVDAQGRLNYPMVLARAIDEAGGDAFVTEYRGYASPSTVGTSYCCSGEYDVCGIGHNGTCECPASAFDQTDCASLGDLPDGVTLLDTLGTKYTTLTRLTTRVSPEEMTFDPAYEPDFTTGGPNGRLQLYAKQPSLANCSGAVIDRAKLADITAKAACAAMYCGPGSECVTTEAGPACACAANTVAERYVDLDNKPSITCVPATPPVDLRAGGDVLPDACANVSCGDGRCVDRNGVPVCVCDSNTAATLGGTSLAPRCLPIQLGTHSPGAESFSEPLRALDVCAPAPPICFPGGKLENVGTSRPGIDCGNATPRVDDQYQGESSSGCQETRSTAPVTFAVGAWFVLALIVRRRRGARCR